MILRNIIVGNDKYGHILECGDICSFDVRLQRPNSPESIESIRGMIIYDEDSFAFAFETLDDFAPILLMSCAELHSIERLFEANKTNFEFMPNGSEWKEIYRKNLEV